MAMKETAAPPPELAADAVRKSSTAFPVVGIGASAGGLEALEQFLANVPAHSGIAYVIVQHLDPTHKGMMPELLQRATSMPVQQVRNRMRVRPDHLYVIPPNRDMSIMHGALHLFTPAAPRGQRLPIDFFFKSLAEDLRQLAVGVILSGMGSDGTVGLRAIKENAGIAAAQDPRSAAFSAMPQSAIDAGLVDLVAAAEQLPGRIIESIRCGTHPDSSEDAYDSPHKSGLEAVLTQLRLHNGQDFSLYKKSTLYRRIERRMAVYQIDRIADYVGFLQNNPQELDLLFKEFLIGVTSFFRDPQTWNSLRDVALPKLLDRSGGKRALRAWVPGCSTGQEAYSLAICFREAIAALKPVGRFSLQVFATDLDADAIAQARQGRYPATIASEVSEERLARYFVADDDGYKVSKEIREMVVFAPQNVIQDPPFTKLDLLICRNLQIYFGPQLQKKLMPLFHYSLAPGGVLFLGTAETLGSASDLFTALDARSRIFVRNEVPGQAPNIELPIHHPATTAAPVEDAAPAPAANLQNLADRLLLSQFAPAAVIVNDRGDIIYINGRTGHFLEPAAGKANWNIHAMARPGLRHDLGNALYQVNHTRGRVERTDLRVSDDGVTRRVAILAQMIDEPQPLSGMTLVTFAELPALPEASHRKRPADTQRQSLELALSQAHLDYRNLHDEMQGSQEALQSTNEELQSANEELQSTNEELATSKEEMQSLNEELQTVNIELQSKLEDLSRISSDMENLLNSTQIATIFLDSHMRIRRFTPFAARIIKLIASDIGRPLSDLVSDLEYPALEHDANEVLRTLMLSEKEATTRDDRWFSVRIMPYRTMDNVIDGVVITLVDISVAKRLEAQLRGGAAAQATTIPQATESSPLTEERTAASRQRHKHDQN